MKAWLLAVCMFAASVGHADTTAKAKAKQLYEEGLRHFNVAEYPAAIVAWKESYLLVHKALVLFNIGQAYRLAGDCTHALTFYDNYLREEPTPKNQDDVDQAIAACKSARPAESDAHEPAKLVETKPVEPTRPTEQTGPSEAQPPPSAPHPTATIVAASSGATVVSRPAPHHSRVRRGGIVVGAIGLASGAVGTFYAIRSKQDSDALNGYSGAWTSVQSAKQSDGQTAVTRAWGFGIGGVALAAVGASLFVLGGRESSAVAIAPLHGGAAVAWGTAF